VGCCVDLGKEFAMKKMYPLLSALFLIYWGCEEADIIPPTVSITTAFSGSVSEIVTISIMVNDESGIDKVELWVDGVNTDVTDDTEPYTLLWNTSSYEDSSAHVIVVRVYDTSGNTADSQPVTLTVDNTASAPQGGNITFVTYTLTEMVVVWEQSEDEDLQNYKVLYSETESGDKDTIATYTDKTTTSHTMAEFDPTHENWFWVQLTDTLGFSRVGAGMTNEIDSPPNQSEFYGLVYENDSFIITWSQNIDADFQSYTLYESFSEDMSGATLIYETDLLADTTYTVTGINSGETRYYQVVTKDVFGLETESESIMGATYLFQANFTNDWLCADCGEGIIFFSETDGTFITMATWTGNASFDIPVPEGLSSVPDKFSVTTITGGGTYAYLYTNLNIPIGSTWTWGNDNPEPDYDNQITAEFDFQNIPNHSGYILSSIWTYGASNSGTLSSPYNFNFYESPVDIYLKLNTEGSDPQFLWVNDVTGGTEQVDLSNLSATESQTIDLQGNSVGFRKYLYGYPTAGSRYSRRYTLDYGYSYDTTVAEIKVYYPPSTFSDYRTSQYFYDSDNNSEFWYQSVYGDIPNTFDKIDADFDFISTTPTNFQISTTSSNFDQITSRWTQSGYDNYYYWRFYGPSDLTDYSFPSLPNSFLQQYTDFNIESFELSNADLVDHSELDSYEDILNILFNSSDNFYDVVNDFRARVKYPNSTRSSNIMEDYEKENEYYGRGVHR